MEPIYKEGLKSQVKGEISWIIIHLPLKVYLLFNMSRLSVLHTHTHTHDLLLYKKSLLTKKRVFLLEKNILNINGYSLKNTFKLQRKDKQNKKVYFEIHNVLYGFCKKERLLVCTTLLQPSAYSVILPFSAWSRSFPLAEEGEKGEGCKTPETLWSNSKAVANAYAIG